MSFYVGQKVVCVDVSPLNRVRFRPLDALTEQMDRIESEGAHVELPEPAFA